MDKGQKNSDYLPESELSNDDENYIAQLYADEDRDSSVYLLVPSPKQEASIVDDDWDRKPAAIETENENFEFESIDVGSNEDDFEYFEKIDYDEGGGDDSTDDSFEFISLEIDSSLMSDDTIDSQHEHEHEKTANSNRLYSEKEKKPRTEHIVQDIRNFNSRLSFKSTIEDIENCNSIPDLRRIIRIYSNRADNHIDTPDSGDTYSCAKKSSSAKKRLKTLLFNSKVQQTQVTKQSEDLDYALALSLSYEADHYHGDEHFFNTNVNLRHPRNSKTYNETELSHELISHELNVFHTYCEDEIQENGEHCFCYSDCDIQITKDKEPGQNIPLEHHPGNLWLQDFVTKKTSDFEKKVNRMSAINSYTMLDKKRAGRELVSEILCSIRRSGRRFFRLYEGLGVVWVDIDDKDAHDEVVFLFERERLRRERMQTMVKRAGSLRNSARTQAPAL